MRYWERVEENMGKQGVLSVTHKLIIKTDERDHKFYMKIGWWHGRPVYVDMTVARHGENASSDTPDIHESALPIVTSLRQKLMDNTRSTLEVICREASLLLSSRRCTLENLSELWRVTQLEPKGRCDQVNDELGDKVQGPLDAAAKLFELKAKEWERKMAYTYTETEIEQMIEDCLAVIGEYEDEFTGWEVKFINDVSQRNETDHLSPAQVEKLEQVWEERDCAKRAEELISD